VGESAIVRGFVTPQTTQRWLARFSWSFCIIAVWLLYEAHLLNLRGGPAWEILLLVVGAAAAFGMGAAGIRARHRYPDDETPH
jgi:hypothetical protein